MRALNDYLDLGYNFYFWRTKTKIEVALIAYGERGILSFEIKRTAHLRKEDFREEYPSARCILFYGGSKRYVDDNIEVIPLIDGIKEMPEILRANQGS